MTITRTTAKAAAFGGSVLLALSLAACGSNNEGETSTPTTEASTTEAPTTEEPASEEPASEEATTDEESADEEATDKATTDAAGSGDEPSRDEMMAGAERSLLEGSRDMFKDQGKSDEQIDEYVGCVVDVITADSSPAEKRALANGNIEPWSGIESTDLLYSSIETCVEKLSD